MLVFYVMFAVLLAVQGYDINVTINIIFWLHKRCGLVLIGELLNLFLNAVQHFTQFTINKTRSLVQTDVHLLCMFIFRMPATCLCIMYINPSTMK